MAEGAVTDRSRAGDDQRWRLAVDRQRELRVLLDKPGRTRADIDEAAQRLGIHSATVYRLLARYAFGETAQAVVTGFGGWKAGRPRLPARVVDIIDATIEDVFLDRQAPSKAELGRQIARRCAAAGLAAPSASAIDRRLQRVGQRERVGRRQGRAAAEAMTMASVHYRDTDIR